MKLKISRKELSGALSKMNKTIDVAPINSVLACVKFEVTTDGIYLTGSNTVISVKNFLPISDKDVIIKDPGCALLKYKELLSIVRNCDGDMLNISKNDENPLVKINGVKSRFKLKSMDVDAFPNIAFDKDSAPVKMKSANLITTINMTSYAVSTKEVQPVLGGIHFQGLPNMISFIATDKYRVAKTDLSIENDKNFNFTINAPELSAALLYFKDIEEVDMYLSERFILLEAQNIIVKLQTLSSGYPSLERLLANKNWMFKGTTNVKDLLTVINRAAILATDDKTIKMYLSEDKVKFYTNDDSLGTFEENIEDILKIEKNETLPEDVNSLELATSIKYLSDALKTSQSETISINYTGVRTPIYLFDEIENIKRTQIITPHVMR